MFAFGTLVPADRRVSVMGAEGDNVREAVLPDFIKQGLNILPQDGSEVTGIVFDVDEEQLASLDRYEGYPNLYHRIPVTVFLKDGEDTPIEATAYQLVNSESLVVAP